MTKNDFYNQWFKIFASDIPRKDIEKYVVGTGNCIWHIFSWRLLDEKKYLVGDEARNAYDEIDKAKAECIEWYEDKCTKKLASDLHTAKALDKLVEIYVIGKNFEWAYIKTHENDMCGPYFIRKT